MHNKIRKRSFNVKFPGFVSDTPGAFSAGDVFFFPSYGENQPLVILETASLGIPMVVRDLAEYEGWLVHGENCLKGRTNSEFVSHLERLSSDKKLYKRLSEGANELAEANSLERVGKQLARLYNFVLNGRINE
jgi:1,2-diacylglycerol-3-alpha-glucose alpha-1,2-glucosyltransferase